MPNLPPKKTNTMLTSEMLIYQDQYGKIKIDVRLEDDTVWLTQAQLCELFQKSKATISEHIKNVFAEGELDEKVVVRKFRTTTQHGAIAGKTQAVEVNGYNLDVIISVGYRVKSPQGTQFRIWATQRLKEYIIKGFALNDDRFKSGTSINYFNKLQEQLRDIRLSERFFYFDGMLSQSMIYWCQHNIYRCPMSSMSSKIAIPLPTAPRF